MISAFDDYLIHQTGRPIEEPATGDRRFYDRYYFNFFNQSGGTYVLMGMAVYPNNGVMDAFVMVTTGNGSEQRNLRASRLLVDRDRHRSVVGPISIEVLEPLKRCRLRCEPNDQGFAFDVIIETLTGPFQRKPHHVRMNGHTAIENSHYSQSYRCEGSITIDGQTEQIAPDRWWGIRDHSWGVRGGVYPVEPASAPAAGMRQGPYEGNWIPVMFEDCYVMLYFRPGAETAQILFPWGEGRPPLNILDIERTDVEFDMDRRRFAGCRLVLKDEDDRQFELSLKYLSSSFLRGGGYGGIGDFLHGKPMGALHLEGERWDLTRPNFIDQPGIAEHLIEVQWDDRVGYGIFNVVDEALIARPYGRYQSARSTADPSQGQA